MINWKPPLKCRLFGHRWKSIGKTLMLENVDECKRCGCGRMSVMFGAVGYQLYTPQAVADSKEKNKAPYKVEK